MAHAIQLAGNGFPAPNPRVGCVLVKHGEVVGQGYHAFAGGPHAEAVALTEAGNASQGATAYVTLEPCNHHGRTPPCSQALIQAGVAEVVYAVGDPNAAASGGAASLRGAGVVVRAGLLAGEAEQANHRWLTAVRRNRPYVALKAAMTLDGRICLPNGQSQWITGEKARKTGRLLRAEMGAVLVGSGTVAKDNPELTVRDAEVHNEPVRIVLDPLGGLSGSEKALARPGSTIWYVAKSPNGRQAVLPAQGEAFDLTAMLLDLYARGIRGVLVEGGSMTTSSFLRAGLADELHLFIAPKVFGSGTAWANLPEIAAVNEAQQLGLVSVEQIDSDIYATYRSR